MQHRRSTILAVCLTMMVPAGARAEPLQLDRFFNGSFTGSGSVDNFRDGSHRTFTASMKASWSGPRGTLVEDLSFADGEKKHLAWSFEKTGEGQFVGHRDDLIHDADVTTQDGEVRMRYAAKTRVPDGKVWDLSFDERFTQSSPTTVTMTGNIAYLFIGVGVTHMTIKKSGH